jgi:opacity protein-like surface antigen
MKKILSCMIFAIVFVTGLSAAPLRLSAGGGGLLGYTFTRYTLEGSGENSGPVESTQTMDRFNYGGLLFFDATYGEFAVLLHGGHNAYEEEMIIHSAGNIDNKGTGTEMALGFSLLGKYPLRINEKLVWFPLLGAEYQIALLEWRKPQGGIVYDRTEGKLPEDKDENDDPYPLSAWNSLTIDLGAGLDYAINERLFLRGELLFSFRLQTTYETGALELAKAQTSASDVALKGLTGGPTFRMSLGYLFPGNK